MTTICRFEREWLGILGVKLIPWLTFRDILALIHTFPIVCDSVFHGFPVTPVFMDRHWKRLIRAEHDFVRSHDCYTCLYVRFAKHVITPSACVLPTPTEGFYPEEPYIAWRLTSLFCHSPESILFIQCRSDLHIQSVCPLWLGTHNKITGFELIHIPQKHLYQLSNGMEQSTMKWYDILCLVFEILCSEIVTIELSFTNIEESDLLTPLSNYYTELDTICDVLRITKRSTPNKVSTY
jgi:hypothetical protein